jgi:TatA/E family protein of Tat protein translocase
MFDIGLQEMLLIGVIALLVFGPTKLPELGRMFGRAMREFRRASDEFRSTVETNLHINDTELFPSTPAPSTIQTTYQPPPVAEVITPRESLPSESESATAALGEKPAVATESGEPFVAQRGSRIFHRRECAWVARIPSAERLEFPRFSAASEQGFATCPVCEPWEPA